MRRPETALRAEAPPAARRRLVFWVTALLVATLSLEFRRGAAARSVAPGAPGSRAVGPPAASGPRRVLAFARRLYGNIAKHRVFAIAAGVAFYSILAIFPAIAALVSLYGLFADAGAMEGHIGSLSGFLPGGALEVVHDQLNRVVANRHDTLGITFASGLLISLWSANSGIKALFDALNIVYGETEKRGLIKLNAVSLAFTLGAIAFLLVALGGLIVLPHFLAYIGPSSATEIAVDAGRWPVLFVAVALGLALIYRFGASRTAPRWRWISGGSAAAALGWLAVSLLFSWYTAHFGQYNKTYGSLGAIIGFMTWIWISAVVILIGGELDADMERADDAPAPRP